MNPVIWEKVHKHCGELISVLDIGSGASPRVAHCGGNHGDSLIWFYEGSDDIYFRLAWLAKNKVLTIQTLKMKIVILCDMKQFFGRKPSPDSKESAPARTKAILACIHVLNILLTNGEVLTHFTEHPEDFILGTYLDEEVMFHEELSKEFLLLLVDQLP